MTKRAGWPFLIAAAMLAAFALFVAGTGGVDTRIGGIPLRSRSWERPAIIGAVLAAIAAWCFRREILTLVVRVVALILGTAKRLSPLLPIAAISWSGIVSIAFGTFAAGGSDSYGYISQAELMADGRLIDTIARDAAFRWPDPARTLTPLGYTRGTAPDALAPIYAPGLPLMMAPLASIASRAVFAVVPFCAVCTVFLCWRLGRSLEDPLAAPLGAALVAASPTFLYQAIQPMSDVPVTACWTGALLLARRGARWAAPAAGVAASLAILIRPNLAPLAAFVVAAAATTTGRTDLRRALACGVAMAPGIVLLGFIQHVRYGSALASGYGPFSDLFSLDHVAPNLARYPRWLVEAHSPFIILWLIAPLWIVRAAPRVRALAWICWTFCVAVIAAYLPYVYFRPDEWFYTRFLLPGIPLMLLLGTATAFDLARRVAPRVGSLLVVLLALGAIGYGVVRSKSVGVFELREAERKYPAVGTFVRDRLPASAYVFAMQHSGSVKYYAGRQTIRWDVLDRAWLDRTVAALRASGHEPYAVLDPHEDEEFRRRFASAAQQSVQRMVQIGTIRSTRIYAFE